MFSPWLAQLVCVPYTAPCVDEARALLQHAVGERAVGFTAGLPLAMMRHFTWSGVRPGSGSEHQRGDAGDTAADCEVPTS
jgi:hypothetical protein